MQNRKRPALVAAALWLGFVWAAAPGGAAAQQADARDAASSSNPDSLDAFREVLRAALRGDAAKPATKHAGKHARPARQASVAKAPAPDAPAADSPVPDALTGEPQAAPPQDADVAAAAPSPKVRRHVRAAAKAAPAEAQVRTEDPRAALSSDADVAAAAASSKARRHARAQAKAAASADAQAPADDPRAAESSPEDAAAVATALDERRKHARPTDFDPKAAVEPAAAEPAEDMPSPEILRMAQWVLASGDHGDRPFVVIDKNSAEVAVFDADGTMLGAVPALIGLARGDDSVPGIGTRKLSQIAPDERTTPAGRFVAGYGPGFGKRPVLWVDYGDSISMHPVVTTNPREHRPERLQSASPDDRRITFGCINVSAGFYQEVVSKVFAGQKGVVYILPESRSIDEVFPAYAAWARTAPAAPARLSQAAP